MIYVYNVDRNRYYRNPSLFAVMFFVLVRTQKNNYMPQCVAHMFRLYYTSCLKQYEIGDPFKNYFNYK